MSFLTSEEAGLGQNWYDESNVVAGVGGLLSMSELTTLKNYYEDPPLFPASVGLNGLGIPASDLVPGELESGQTLVDTTSVGNVRHKRNQSWHGRRRRRGSERFRQIREQGLCQDEIAASKAARANLRSCAKRHTRTQVQAGVAEAGTPPVTVASEGIVLGAPVPISDLVSGELTHAAKMIALPQAFGGMGAGSPIPIRDLSHGEYETAGRMISHPQAFGNRAVPISDLIPGEYVTGATLVDHAQAFGGLGMYHGQYGRDLVVPSTPGVPGATGASHSHAAKMLSLPQARRALPVADLVPGEPTSARSLVAGSHAEKMRALPQASRALPVADLVPGELVSARALVAGSHAEKMRALPQASRALPVADLVPGELTHAEKMIALPQAFGGMGSTLQVGPKKKGNRHGNYGLPISDLVRGEYERAGRIVGHPQSFSLGNRDVPISDLVPGEYVTGRTLVDHAQGFGSYHGQYGGPVEDRAVPIADLVPGELTHAEKMISLPQAFGGVGAMNDFIPWLPGSPEPRDNAQGSFLAVNQVPAWALESGDDLASQPQNFGGLGAGSPVPRGDFVEGEIESAARLARHPQAFGGMGAGSTHASQMISLPQASGGMGDFLPYEAGMPEPKDGGQGTWLSPSQVPAWDRESAQELISSPESFGGMGASGDNVALPELNLAPICDPQTGACISYATPQEIRSAIGAKIGGRSALVQGKAKLPAFYEHPNLGPWGVDPRQAYQYWWAQQASMERAGVGAPIPIWGSPGSIPVTKDLPPSPIAQEASFNPYTNAYPVAGTSVERF